MTFHRRTLIAALGGAFLAPIETARATPPGELRFDNLHTGESLSVVYRENACYLDSACAQIDHVLRDYRTGEVHVIDRRLLDLLTRLSNRLGAPAHFEVISGYRSPATNAMLHEASSGVSTRSLHMQGMAIDLRMPNATLEDVRNAALSLRGGGVGFYPESNFVHVDVGRVRHW